METKSNYIEPLLDKTEAYAKSSFELLKLKALDKTADVTSSIISRSLIVIVISCFAFALNIAAALWLGDMLGKSYYGFLIVAACYALAAVVLLIMHPFIKDRTNNAIIRQLFN
jgi:hypothetical protein